ncbi:MAG: class D beta-lactamase, partial [Pseudomonadota bacterium]
MKLLLLLALIQGGTGDPCARSVADARIDQLLEAAGATGVVLVWKEGETVCRSNAPGGARDRSIPASTFKIPNSLIALETGVIRDEHAVFTWDGVERQIASWNRDHDLASAIRYSAVWYYQELARRIGPERMQTWIDRMGYGNRDISGGIDRFWLDGGMRISPREQIAFLHRLVHDRLPVSPRSQAIVRRILVQDYDGPGALYGKTGWAVRTTPEVGWFVGWFERGDDRWFFATRLDIEAPAHVRARRSVSIAV